MATHSPLGEGVGTKEFWDTDNGETFQVHLMITQRSWAKVS
jgi:hypothetical protein